MQAVGYVRVSTAEQATEGVSLAAQRARIAAWAEANDAGLIEVFTDAGLSGGRADNRPGLQAALDRACHAKAALVVYSLSRLARSTRDAIAISERLDTAGADLVSLSEKIDTTTAAGKMVFRMLAVLAEFERDQISERTMAAMQHKRARREYTGGKAPYGWRVAADGVTLEPDPTEQQVIRVAVQWRARHLSLRQIGARLSAGGMPPRNGRAWHPQGVKVILAAVASEAQPHQMPAV
ncbi:MAG: recombinase family protein [Candidatus Binatia bacterium]